MRNIEKMVVDLSSDEEDAEKMVIDLSSDEEDVCRLVVNPSHPALTEGRLKDLADKRKGADEMVCYTKGRRPEADMKKLKLALVPSVSSSVAVVSKDSRVKKKKADTPAACEKMKKLKIPRIRLRAVEPVTEADLLGRKRYITCGYGLKAALFDMHASLANKRVILYGLPGYHPAPGLNKYALWDYTTKHAVWGKFFLNQLLPLALEFVEHQADILKANGVVDQILFIVVNANLMMVSMHNDICPSISSRYPYVRVVCDATYHDPKLRSFYRGLRLGPEICEEWIPPRCRSYFFLLDDKKVKYSNFESPGQVFIPPTTEEIIKAFSV